MTADRCPCGEPIYADTEDWEVPLCYECYVEMNTKLKDCPFKEISLTKGRFAKVDSDDYDNLMKYKWHTIQTHNSYYAGRTDNTKNRRLFVHMHRQVMGTLDQNSNVVDHINGDTLDNRKSNLRICTHRENLRNQKPQLNRSSKFKGVYWSIKEKCWVVQIKDQGRMRTVHGIDDQEIAAMIYDLMAIDRFKEFALPNLINTKQEAISAWNTRHQPSCRDCTFDDGTYCAVLEIKTPARFVEVDYSDFYCAKFFRREE